MNLTRLQKDVNEQWMTADDPLMNLYKIFCFQPKGVATL